MARDDTDIEGTREDASTAGLGRLPAGDAPRRLRAVPPSALSPEAATLRALSGPHAAVASGAMTPEEVARVTLEALRQRHRDLDEAIAALESRGGTDPLSVRRLKKRKLALRDRIAAIEDRLTPDIIA